MPAFIPAVEPLNSTDSVEEIWGFIQQVGLEMMLLGINNLFNKTQSLVIKLVQIEQVSLQFESSVTHKCVLNVGSLDIQKAARL